MTKPEIDLYRKLLALEPGQRMMYFRGETGQMPPMLAMIAMRAVDEGAITIVHKKLPESRGDWGVYEYWAVGV